MAQQMEAPRRVRLSRDRVLRAAVALADNDGIESLSMRKLAQELGVVPMALYKHVANKEELLDGMVDVVVGEIDLPVSGTDWKIAVRQRILSARRVLLRHLWASRVLESRTNPTPVVLAYMDSMIGIFRAGGFSIDLTHHVMHTVGSRIFGFTQELFDNSPSVDPQAQASMPREMAQRYPYITELTMAISHDEDSVVGQGCDDQFEFEFALDLLLDGIDKLRQKERRSAQSAGEQAQSERLRAQRGQAAEADLPDRRISILFGRRLFEVMEEPWTAAASRDDLPAVMTEFASAYVKTPRIVFSDTLDSVPEGVRLVRGADAVAEVTRLKQQTEGDLALGGASLAASLVDLIDEFRLCVMPVVVGGGKPFFAARKQLRLRLAEQRAFASGALYLRYERAG